MGQIDTFNNNLLTFTGAIAQAACYADNYVLINSQQYRRRFDIRFESVHTMHDNF